jgi:hypothetical protein
MSVKYDAHVGATKVFSDEAPDVKSALAAAKKLNPKVTHINVPKGTAKPKPHTK